MLAFTMVKEYLNLRSKTFIGPKKWQWKGDRNKAAQGSDIVLFHSTKIPSTDDTIVTVEVKMKSIKSNNSPLQKAVEGATDDKLTRMAKSLHWFDEKLAKDGKVHLRNKLKRFRRPSEYVSYNKEYLAVAVIDKELIDEELKKPLTHAHKDIDIWAISIESLKEAYQDNYFEMSNISW